MRGCAGPTEVASAGRILALVAELGCCIFEMTYETVEWPREGYSVNLTVWYVGRS